MTPGGYIDLPTTISDRTAELAGRAVVLGHDEPEDARLVLDALGLLERLREARAS